MASLLLAVLVAVELPCTPAGLSPERSAGQQPALSEAFMSAFDEASVSGKSESAGEGTIADFAAAVVLNPQPPLVSDTTSGRTNQNFRGSAFRCRGPRCEDSAPHRVAKKRWAVEAKSASEQLTAGLGSCAPSASSLEVLSLSESTPGLPETINMLPSDFKFYLLSEGPFDMDDTVHCLLEHMGTNLAKDDMDLHLMPNWSEHLVDLWLLKQLQDHPMRTRNPAEAQLHVVGTPLTASYLAATTTDGMCGSKEDHERRSKAIKDALAASPQFQECNGCNFLFSVSSPFFRRILGSSLWKFLLADKPVLFATADRDYHQTVNNRSRALHRRRGRSSTFLTRRTS